VLLSCVKNERRGNFLLYAKPAAVCTRALGPEVFSVEGFRHGRCVKTDFRQRSTRKLRSRPQDGDRLRLLLLNSYINGRAREVDLNAARENLAHE
jgi:hypothetical protein